MPERHIEFDHHPEIVEGNKGIRRLELLGLKETFREPESRRQHFVHIEDDSFAKMLGYINSVTRGEPIRYDFGDGKTPFMETPPLEDKGPLMGQAFATVREILSEEGLDERVALRRAALTIAGAVNYIHPYTEGNGRTGRVMHYLLEFGTERGEQAFNDELYAIIGKLPVYEAHSGRALDDTPPPELTLALDAVAQDIVPTRWATLDERAKASARVHVFLDMMKGTVAVPVTQDVHRRYRDPTSLDPGSLKVAPGGTLDGRALYEREYLDHSAIPHYQPRDVPEATSRVIGARPNSEPGTVSLNLDVLGDL